MEPAAKKAGLAGNPNYEFIKQANRICEDLQNPNSKVTPEAIVEFVTSNNLLIKQAPHLFQKSLSDLSTQISLLGERYQNAAALVKQYIGATKIDRLPLPVLGGRILPNTKNELSQMSKVCKQWRAVHAHCINENKLPLNQWFKTSAQAVAFLTHPAICEQVRYLDFTSFTIDEMQIVRILENCPNVTHLILYDNSVSGDFLKHLRNVPKLVHLNIQFCSQLDPDSLKYLQHVPLLEELNIAGLDQLQPDFLSDLKHVPLLRTLIASSCPLKNDALRHLQLVRHLRVLDVSQCFELAGDSIKNLVYVPLLLELYLSGCSSLETDALKRLALVHSLNKLSVAGCTQFPLESFKDLSHVGSLVWLNLQYCTQLTTLQFLGHVPLLTYLDLAACSALAPDALTQLQRVSKLTSLILTHCTTLGPEALENLRFIPGLSHLDITGCGQLSPNSINKVLVQMLALRTFNMAMCKQIPHNRREQMKLEFPQVRII